MKENIKRVEIVITGTVQGVGFRPFLFRIARKYRIKGSVWNSSKGVKILLESNDQALKLFLKDMSHSLPPMAVIRSLDVRPYYGKEIFRDFKIKKSEQGESDGSTIPPDMASCEACLSEVFDPSDRRYAYPFTNCTDCGPRFSIVSSTPYDRPFTSMKEFNMCPLCLKEYNDPLDRRFHAQPNACACCGPSLSWHDGHGDILDSEDPVGDAAKALEKGFCVAIKGVGGFHLSVNPFSDEAVSELRRRKKRKSKPLALMVPDIDTAKALCSISQAEEHVLVSPIRPILIASLRRSSLSVQLSSLIAPGINDVGIMLAYTPLHHILFKKCSLTVLVMTSGNRSGSPIIGSEIKAFSELSGVADYFLIHDREIVNRIDDSVVKVMNGKEMVLRRARGYVPAPFRISFELPATVACGADLKNTFCIASGKSAVPGQHTGDLFDRDSYDFFLNNISCLKRLTGISPVIAACDLHPDYVSSRYAADTAIPVFKVQHHHAHAVSVMAEHGINEPVLAVVMDGTGYGEDGTLWGGEFLYSKTDKYRRLAHLEQIPVPGGDMATREIWRMGVAVLHKACCMSDFVLRNNMKNLEELPVNIILQMVEKGINTPLSSGCGRLFDAIASILGIRHHVEYEGQAAMELEALASKSDLFLNFAAYEPILPVEIKKREKMYIVRTASMIRKMVSFTRNGLPVSSAAFHFHLWLSMSVEATVYKLSLLTGVKKVVLAGGCFQNRVFFEMVSSLLEKQGFSIYSGENIPVNDGGISLGQAVVAGAVWKRGLT